MTTIAVGGGMPGGSVQSSTYGGSAARSARAMVPRSGGGSTVRVVCRADERQRTRSVQTRPDQPGAAGVRRGPPASGEPLTHGDPRVYCRGSGRRSPAPGLRGGLSSTAEQRIVDPQVMGSKPIGHPNSLAGQLCARHAVGHVPGRSPKPTPRRMRAVSIQRRLAACSAEMSAKAAAAAGAWSCSITIQPS